MRAGGTGHENMLTPKKGPPVGILCQIMIHSNYCNFKSKLRNVLHFCLYECNKTRNLFIFPHSTDKANISKINPRPAGPLDFPPPTGGVVENPPPSISAPGPRSDTQQAAFERASKIMTKLLRHFLGQVKGQVTRGHQKLNLAYFYIFRQTGA